LFFYGRERRTRREKEKEKFAIQSVTFARHKYYNDGEDEKEEEEERRGKKKKMNEEEDEESREGERSLFISLQDFDHRIKSYTTKK
jgi:hypothetical protein